MLHANIYDNTDKPARRVIVVIQERSFITVNALKELTEQMRSISYKNDPTVIEVLTHDHKPISTTYPLRVFKEGVSELNIKNAWD